MAPTPVGKAIERAYAALAREQRAGKMTEVGLIRSGGQIS